VRYLGIEPPCPRAGGMASGGVRLRGGTVWHPCDARGRRRRQFAQIV
jgi:hypothetical protein